MAISKNDIDLIDKFLRNGLSERELFLFNKRLEDKEFKEEVDFKEGVKRAAKKAGRSDLKAKLQELEANRVQPKTAKRVSLRPWLLAAASILLLVIAFFWFNTQQPSSADLLVQYYAPYPNVLTEPIVKGTSAKGDWEIALQQYELKNYQEANLLLDEFPDTDSSLFYLAITEMELKDFALATAIFKEVLSFENSTFEVPSWYYLGLCALQVNDRKTAQVYFKKVRQSTAHPKLVQQAKEILRKLE